ncbi:MAG: lysophospholipid acyltransferase family protein [Pseudomonadales bacterium]|nr:lysophospholipid acyltransferase family protein [Pseudomonadales bacterium]
MAKPTILVLRSLVFYLGYSLSLLLHATLSLLVGLFLPIRARFRFVLLWNRFAIWWLKVTCHVNYTISGLENIPPGPFVVLSNHQSPWETIILYTLFIPICATLKRELLRIPFFGWAIAIIKPIAIDRSRATAARRTLLNQGRQRLAEGLSVLVFPEGTRVAVGSHKKFTASGAELAIANKVPVLPVAHNAGLYWPPHQLVKKPGTIHVRIGKPLASEGRSPRELTAQVEDWIRNAV